MEHLSSVAQLHLLGSFRLQIGTRGVELPVQARRVLGFLALEDGFVARSTLAGRLWETCTTKAAHARLRTAVWRVRREADETLVQHNDLLALAPEVEVDLRRAQGCARRLGGRGAEPDLGDAELLTRDLLPEWDEDWLVMDRECFRQDRLHGLERLSRALSRRGRHGDAISMALAAVAIEPLRESAQIALVGAHLSEGNVSEGIRQFETYRQLLHSELGIDPSYRLTSMVAPYVRTA